MLLKNLSALAIGIVMTIGSGAALADGIDPEVLTGLLGKEAASHVAIKQLKNDDALRLTSNKDQIIRLNQDASSVVVNNPAHAEVMLDSPRVLIIMPRAPGATSFTVLNSKGDIILRRDVIVTNVQPKYVRIRRMCSGADSSCVPAAYYYCPDGCYEITPVGEASGNGSIPAPVGAALNSASSLAGQPGLPSTMPNNAPSASNAGSSGDGANDGGNAASPDDHPVGDDGEPATYPGQQP